MRSASSTQSPLYRALPDAELAVIPGTSDGLMVEKPELCNTIVVDFLTAFTCCVLLEEAQLNADPACAAVAWG